MSHPNAPLTPEGRRRLCQRVDAGRPICQVAAEAGVARQTVAKWHTRWSDEGEAGLIDRSSRPAGSPKRTTAKSKTWSNGSPWHKARAGDVGRRADTVGIDLAASTIGRILVRRGVSRLRDLDVSGATMRVVTSGWPDNWNRLAR